MARTSALFDFLLQRQYAEADMARQRQEQEKLAQSASAEKERSFWGDYFNKDADRKIKLMELQSKSAGALGQPAPQADGFDPREQEAVQPSYMAGEVEKQKGDDAEALKRFQLQQQMDWHNAQLQGQNERAGDTMDFRKLQLEQQRAIAAGRLDDARMYHQMMLQQHELQMEMARQRMEETHQRGIDSKKVQLGKDLAPYEQEHADISHLADPNNNLSGIGPIAGNVPTWMLDVASSLGSTTADDAISNRQAASNISRLIALATGGKTLTTSELQGVYRSYNIYNGAPKEAFRAGVNKLAQDAARGEAQIRNSYPPDAVSQYDEGSRAVPLPLQGGGQPSQQSRQAPPTRGPNGEPVRTIDGETRYYNAQGQWVPF